VSRPFIDSNVVLYLLSGDIAKANRAEELLYAGGIVSVQKRYQLSIYDSNIIACALISGASKLLTEDMQGGQLIDTLQIYNPFKVVL